MRPSMLLTNGVCTIAMPTSDAPEAKDGLGLEVSESCMVEGVG